MIPLLSPRLSALALLSLTLAGQTADEPADRPARPNIVMVVLDDLSNWIGALGGPADTPNIARLRTYLPLESPSVPLP